MWPKGYLLFCTTLSTFFFISNGCQMDGIGNWQLPAMLQIYDIDRGTFFSQATSNIVGINSITYGEGLNGGPYIDITFTNSVFNITTNSAYPAYEENETSQSMSITVVFGCTGGSPSTLVFLITVVDTNNNPPQFIPESYEFTLSPPLPPGFLVTGCVNDIIARDIDLTTQRIDFTIEDNPYFEIAYDEESSTEPKEFKAVLKTTTLIRTLPEVIELTITATDVDLTNDPPLSTTAVIRIQGDSEFELPEEPVFSESFYVVSYSESNQIVQQQPISLEKGYDDEVLFTLEGEYSDNFELSKTENQLSILVKTPLSTEILKSEWQVLLVVRAERELTSGATATVIVNLPQVVSLEFEQVQYEGMIIDNVLQPLQLILSQGYEDGFAIVILNEYASFFTPSVQGNVITVTMSPLDDDIIYGNNIISLQVVASTEYNVSATAIVTLHIIKDDKITPVFDKAIYMGSYDTDDGISLEQIVLAQGYDTTVSFSLEGEHSSFFDISNDGPIVNVTSSSLPVEILTESYLILTVAATKPRTVGANATISITLPPARELFFQESTYTGTVEDNFLALEPIVLSVGYGDDVTFNLTGDYADLFSTSVEENVVSLNLSTQLPVGVILENNFILLTLSAVGLHTTTTSTNILLEILKQDITTPVFSQKNYRGSYSGLSNIDIDIITLIQGYDSSVSFRLDGEHADYFKINSSDNNNITLEIQSDIPEDLIFNEKVLVFNILAEKPLTVGGNSAITIGFPQELTDTAVMKFSRDTYIGSLENNTLTLENITLETGFAAGTNFSLKGDYSSYFTFSNEDNIMTVILLQVLPTEIFENNKFIVLQAEAQREKAVTVSASIVIDLIQEEIIIPKFNEPYYSGVYTEETGLQFEQNIFLSQGYDGTVTFDLDGDDAMWFTLTQNGNSISVVQDIVIPQDVLEEKNQLLFTIIATKPKATGNAVISIDLPKEIPIPVVLSFTQSSFVGRIENDELITPNITLVAEYQQPLQFNITGEYAAYFGLIQQDSTIEIALINELPLEATEENAFIILDIEVSFPEAFSGYTAVVLEIVKKPEPEIITPVFEQPYYMGEYSDQYGLLLQQPIQLIQGFDESVLFSLTGDDSDWFDIDYNGPNNLSLSIVEDGLQQIKDRSHLVFSIIANKSDSLDGRAAIVITLTDFGIIKQVEFSQTFYKGIIENGNLTTDTIILSEGYTADMNVTFSGDYVDFFELTNQENIFTIQLLAPLQDEIIDANNVLILAIDVLVENVKSHTTVIIEIIKTDIIPLVFDEIYYVGSYSETENFNFEKNITVIKGYDDTVTFSLDGENAKWFGWQQEENSITLTVTNPIPNEVIANTSHLIFTITAYKSENMTASATITITLIDDTTTLTFEKNSYLGSLEKDVLIIEPINLRNESVENVTFELTGDLASYFTVANEGLTATISLLNPIPEDSIPSSNIITLELIATAPRSIAAYTTIIFGFVYEEVEQLSFNRTYYTGYYSESESLIFDELITLAEGYDESVEFELDEDGSEWFALNRTTGGNFVSLILKTPISQEIIFNNQQLIFTITAQKPGSAASRATIVITLIQETEDITILGFERNYYLGFVENEVASLDTVTLIEGYFENVTYSLNGDLADYFAVLEEGPTVNITLINTIPEDLIPINRIVVLELQASASQALSAFTTIVFEVVKEEVQQLLFNQTYYTGQYAASDSFVFETPIIISEGYDSNVEISLEGDGIQWFDLNVIENVAQVIVVNPIPQEVLTNNQQIILVINAQKPGSSIARATIVIALLDDTKVILRFERNNYLGYIDNIANIDSIILSEGYTDDVSYNLVGDFADYFTVLEEGPAVNITLIKTIPDDLIPINKIIVLELQASAPQAVFTYTIIVFEFIVPEIEQLIFSQTFYTGEYNATGNVLLPTPIFLTEGYDSYVEFTLEGDFTEWLDLDISENSVNFTVTNPIPQEILANTQQIILVIAAQKPGSRTANATIILTLQDDSLPHTVLAFEKNSYLGSILDNSIYIDPIALEVSTEEVLFNLNGELASYFDLLPAGSAVNIILPLEIPDELVPANGIVILELEASAPGATSAFTTIVLEVVKNDTVVERLLFSETFYTGQYTQSEGLNFTNPIKLVQGYDENVQFTLEGESAQWFEPLIFENSVSLTLLEPIPQTVLLDTQQLIFVVRAEKPKSEVERATVVISLTADLQIDSGVAFDKVLFEGLIQAGIVQHESITVIGYNETNINISGEYAALFTASASAGVVTVQGSGSVTLADDITYVALELGAGSTYAVLILDVIHSENPALPVVIFSSSSYALRIEVGQTGLVGRVLATADNGETVTYALLVDDAHLRQRISINHEGELYLSASANSGVYNFQVSATTVFSGTTGTAPVYLTVDAITVCGDDKLVVPPLITLNRDEEVAHENLVVLDDEKFAGCRYSLTNRWPINQTWLYVDENGLHATAIDREHESIAFMASSQVQVELILECDTDIETKRAKRSLYTRVMQDPLGPYDYGNNEWILTDTILYNSRRSLVNLIVNDINDNTPIFVGKENEPIAVGYPVTELEDRILPRSLAELKATDADIGENAALIYWSSEDVLAVSPSTGFVHVSQGYQIEDGTLLTVHATDRNGDGLTGSIQLLVKLLDQSNIAVVTVRDAFLDDEQTILDNLSAAVGYEVKVLRSVVISNSTEIDPNQVNSRRKRETASATGVSLQLYVYGMIQREPVQVDQLTSDINNNALTTVNVASTISLEDHLDSHEIGVIPGRDTGLLVATIVLSVLLFILIVVAAVWFFLKWRKRQKYDEFSDEASVASQNASLAQMPKTESLPKPKLNIDELKRSERRLQEMLDAPVEEVTVEPIKSKKDTTPESKVNMSVSDPLAPIVIQSIDKLKDVEESDDDEFGEQPNVKRKSVVTFNENVEKIIHLEDTPEEESSDYEVYKF